MTKSFFRQSAASLELIFAATLWGFGFVGVIWALPSWEPTPLLFWRFLIGAVAGSLLSAVVARPKKSELIWLLKTGFGPALFLALMLLLQTWGLKYTTATKSSFITVLYVVLVPVLESVVARKKIAKALWLCILISLIGVYLIVDPSWEQRFNVGDTLTLLCAIAASLQIISLDRVSRHVQRPFLFNVLQSWWATLFLLPVLAFQAGALWPTSPPSTLAWIGLLSVALGSTLIAFYLQVRAQKVLSSTVSSLFFLLESPFALFFAYLFLQERLNVRQAVGAALILASAFLATVREKAKVG